MEKTSKIKYGWLVTAMVVVLLVIDQIIKVYIKTHFCLGESVRVTDWFYIEFVENNGMAWGMSFIGKFWLSLLRLVAICALSIYLHRIIKRGTYRLLYIILVALVLTGAIGNMIDSIFYGLIFTGASPYYVSYLVPFGEGYAPVLMGKVVDATTYNIRRERRDEFIGEASRWEDLIRWRACDQVNGYQIEGMKYWGTVYEGTWLDGETNLAIVDVEGGKGNMSDKTISGDYIRPYQISKINNQVFDGYHFTPAHYLSPIAQSVFRQTAAGDQTDLTTSVVYQNPGWPLVAGQGATAVE